MVLNCNTVKTNKLLSLVSFLLYFFPVELIIALYFHIRMTQMLMTSLSSFLINCAVAQFILNKGINLQSYSFMENEFKLV